MADEETEEETEEVEEYEEEEEDAGVEELRAGPFTP